MVRDISLETAITVSRNAWKYVAEVERSFRSWRRLIPCYAADLNQRSST